MLLCIICRDSFFVQLLSFIFFSYPSVPWFSHMCPRIQRTQLFSGEGKNSFLFPQCQHSGVKGLDPEEAKHENIEMRLVKMLQGEEKKKSMWVNSLVVSLVQYTDIRYTNNPICSTGHVIQAKLACNTLSEARIIFNLLPNSYSKCK